MQLALDCGIIAGREIPLPLVIFFSQETTMSVDVATQLRDLFGPSQARQLDIVRQQLLDDPKALDTHSREVRSPSVETPGVE